MGLYDSYHHSLSFSPKPAHIMHIDINSCFATIEQQANPLIRDKPVAVAAYTSPNGCILAASVEAKRFGIKTGMRVKDGRALYPSLIVLPTDPWKYRNVHLALRKIISKYTFRYAPKSIDEFVLDLDGMPALRSSAVNPMESVAKEIKLRIKEEVGEWIRVSAGIGPNRFLAKVAAGMQKPDGLIKINKENFLERYEQLGLTDLYGIAKHNEIRLKSVGINSVLEFYNAPLWKLKAAFRSIGAYYWYTRLRGWELDDFTFARRSYGNSYSLPKPFSTVEELRPILAKLVDKMSFRMRRAGYRAHGVHMAIRFRDWTFWHHGETTPKLLFETRDIYKEALRILRQCPKLGPVANLAVSCFGLEKDMPLQLELFEDVIKKQEVTRAIDTLNKRWGDFVVTSARMIATSNYIPDRIAFGNVKELEEFSTN